MRFEKIRSWLELKGYRGLKDYVGTGVVVLIYAFMICYIVFGVIVVIFMFGRGCDATIQWAEKFQPPDTVYVKVGRVIDTVFVDSGDFIGGGE